jgi:hypothetical protein
MGCYSRITCEGKRHFRAGEISTNETASKADPLKSATTGPDNLCNCESNHRRREEKAAKQVSWQDEN